MFLFARNQKLRKTFRLSLSLSLSFQLQPQGCGTQIHFGVSMGAPRARPTAEHLRDHRSERISDVAALRCLPRTVKCFSKRRHGAVTKTIVDGGDESFSDVA